MNYVRTQKIHVKNNGGCSTSSLAVERRWVLGVMLLKTLLAELASLSKHLLHTAHFYRARGGEKGEKSLSFFPFSFKCAYNYLSVFYCLFTNHKTHTGGKSLTAEAFLSVNNGNYICTNCGAL